MYFSNLLRMAAEDFGCKAVTRLTLTSDGRVEWGNRETSRSLTLGQLLKVAKRKPNLQGQLWCRRNLRELFLWRDMQNLAGVVRAEQLELDCEEMRREGIVQFPAKAPGLQLTWAYALAGELAHCRYALQQLTLTSTEVQLKLRGNVRQVAFSLGTVVPRAAETHAERYLRLFLRDNAAWLEAWRSGTSVYRLEIVEGRA